MKKKWFSLIPHVYRCLESKLGMKMRATFIVLLICIGQTFAVDLYSQNKRLSLKMTNVSIKAVLESIEDRSDFFFMYEAHNVNVEREVTVLAENKTVPEILNELFANTDITYKITNRQIALTADNSSIAEQQPVKVSGKVTDSYGVPLPGVSVLVKGTSNGIISDANGSYSLSNVPMDATLIFSFVGMKSQEIKVAGKSNINAKLEEENIGLEEVVAVGYGTMKRSDLTGSLSSISSNSIKEHPMNDFSQVLQGRSAGVSVTNTTGSPGQAPRIRIRGANSINGSNDPLYIIDGIPGGSDVNPNDVKSVEILKDASATAIYGSRGASGVILITTFRGDAGAPKITLSSNIGVSQVGKRYDTLNAGDYADLVNKVYNKEMYTPSQISAFRQNGGTNWQDEIFSTGLSQNYQASISGGSGNVKYLFSANYVKEVGTLENTNRDKSGFRANINSDFSKRLSISVDITASTGTRFNEGLGTGGGKLNPILQALIWSPTESVYDTDGNYTNADTYGSLGRNPMLCLNEPYEKKKGTSFGINSNMKYKITNDLSFVGNISVGKSNSYNRNYVSKAFQASNPNLSLNSSDGFGWQLQTLLNYNKKILEKHNIFLTAGFEESAHEGRSMSLTANGVDSPAADIALSSTNSVGQSYYDGGLQSFFGRINYNYASKYFLTATYRADGSSVFEKENQFSYFPSAGLSWMLSEERFIKNLNVFDRLKLRGSWGTTGNQSGINSDSKLSSLRTQKYDYGSAINYVGTEPSFPANTSLRWERTTQRDFGLDASFMKNKLNITMDYFFKETEGVILAKELPLYDGSYMVMQNIGQVNNKGFEFSADYQVVSKNGLEWTIGFNLTTVRNEVIDLGDETRILAGDYGSGMLATKAFVIEPGHPLGSFWGVKYLGLWGTSEAAEALKFGAQPGDSKYEDLNGDYVINNSDYQITGDANPDYSFGINNTINYKNFTFNVLVEGVQGRQVLNVMYAAAALPVGDGRTITLQDGADVWTTSNPNAAFPALSATNINNLQSSRWLQDGSFVKVRNISLAYNFTKSMTKFADVRLSVSGQNLFTFTKYKGYDPEVSNSGSSDVESGIDFGAYPTPQLITTGIAVTF